MDRESDPASPLLGAILNLATFHRDHEKFYASSPRAQAVTLQQHARVLQALADRWSSAEPEHPTPFSPFEGAEDLNDPAWNPADCIQIPLDLETYNALTTTNEIQAWLAGIEASMQP